jgi:hypothetical protein
LILYTELADWWPLLSAPADYAEEASIYLEALLSACARAPRTLIELGSGGGSNASHMKRQFDQVVLVDPSAGMLSVSRLLNQECEHVQGDMRTVRLGRQFDCVFVHDAVCYMTTEGDLRRAVETAFAHCLSGGAAVFAPDFLSETFRPGTDQGGHDGEDRGLRYLEWTWDPNPNDSTYTVDYACLLREADGSTRAVHDRHEEGLFPRAVWLRILSEAGFEPASIPFDHAELDVTSELFVARKP